MNVAEAVELLNSKSQAEIYALMVDTSIKAVPCATQSCAVAVWVTDVTGILVEVGYSMGVRMEETDIFYEVSESVTDFMSAFDNGDYPALRR